MLDLPLKLKLKILNKEFKKAIPLKLVKDKEVLNYKIGFWYWCSYWDQSYKVIDKNCYIDKNGKNRIKNVTILWEDGKETTHNTSLNLQKDYLLLK